MTGQADPNPKALLSLRRWFSCHLLISLAIFALGFGLFAFVAASLDNAFAKSAREDHMSTVIKVQLVLLPAYALIWLTTASLSWPLARRRFQRIRARKSPAWRPRFLRLIASAFLWNLGIFILSFGPMTYLGPGSLDNLAVIAARDVSPMINVYLFKTWHIQEAFTVISAGLFLLLIIDALGALMRFVVNAKFWARTLVGLLLGSVVGGAILLYMWSRVEVQHLPVPRPNIIVLGCDSLRYDHLGCHGYARDTSPNIDAMAREAIDFHQMHVGTASTLESWTSFMTGLHPANHHLRYMFASKEQVAQVENSKSTLPRLLRERGYSSTVVGDWAANCFKLADFGFDHTETSDVQNLDVFLAEVAFRTHPLVPHFFSNQFGEYIIPLMAQATGYLHPGHLTTKFLDRLDESSSKGKPFFGVLFLASTHLPFKVSHPWNQKFVSPDYRGPNRFQVAFDVDDFIQHGFDQIVPQKEKDHIIALYDGGVSQFDDQVGRVLRHLKRTGLDQNTIVVVMSDHGEDLYEPGTTLGHGTNFFGGDQSTRIPFIVRLPAGQLGGRSVQGITRNIDFLPTILDLVKASEREESETRVEDNQALAELAVPKVDGASLVELMTGRSDDLGRAAFSETCYLFYPKHVPGEDVFKLKPADRTLYIDKNFRNQFVLKPKYHDDVIEAKDRMMRTNRWKLIHIKGKRGPIWRFYDMKSDPNQAFDMSGLELAWTPFEEMKVALMEWKNTGRDVPWPKENDWPQ
ncbi:MAG: sulfatase-like hydrolase/transferase [Planctomycetota bacterium]